MGTWRAAAEVAGIDLETTSYARCLYGPRGQKITCVREHLGANEALEAAGLSA